MDSSASRSNKRLPFPLPPASVEKSHRTKTVWFPVFLTLICLFPSFMFAQPQDRRAELKQIDTEIARLRKSLDDLQSRGQSVVTDLEKTRIERDMHLQEIERLIIQIGQADAAISGLEAEIRNSLKIINDKKDAVGAVLRRLYMNGRFDRVKALLNVPSAQDVALAHTYLSYLAHADFETLTAYRDAVDKLKSDQRVLDREKSRLVILREDEKSKEQAAARAQREQERILSGIRRKTEIYQRALKEKISARKELQEFLARLGSNESSDTTGSFAQMQGRLAWPTEGNVIAGFGMIKDHTYDVEIENDGIDIKAAVGTPVRSVGKGIAVFCGWHDAGGNMVVVDHGSGYYTLYAHLSRFDVETGAAVEAGQVIGAVGETGSLKGPLLHFEIRRIVRGQDPQALNPASWLRRNP